MVEKEKSFNEMYITGYITLVLDKKKNIEIIFLVA